MESALLSRRRRVLAISAAAVGTAVCAIWIALGIGGAQPARIIDDGGTALVAILATACCVDPALRDREQRRFWSLSAYLTVPGQVAGRRERRRGASPLPAFLAPFVPALVAPCSRRA